MVEEQLDPGGEQVAGGVATGVDEEQEEPLQFAVGQSFTVDLGLHESGCDVVARRLALLRHHPGRVRQHLEGGRAPFLGRRDRRIGGVHQFGEFVEPLAVLAWDAHQFGDQRRRQAPGEIVHEVAFAPFDDVVDDPASEFADAIPEQFRPLRREAAADEQLEAVVFGRVHDQHHLTLDHQAHLVGLREHHSLRGGAEQLRLAADHADVGVARDRPESGTIDLVVPVHGAFARNHAYWSHGCSPPNASLAVRSIVGTSDVRASRVVFAIRPQ